MWVCYVSSLSFGTGLLQYGRLQKQNFLLLFSQYHLLFFLRVLSPIFNICFWFTVIDSRISERQKEESSGRLITNNIFQINQPQAVVCGPLVVCKVPVGDLQAVCWALVPSVTSWWCCMVVQWKCWQMTDVCDPTCFGTSVQSTFVKVRRNWQCIYASSNESAIYNLR